MENKLQLAGKRVFAMALCTCICKKNFKNVDKRQSHFFSISFIDLNCVMGRGEATCPSNCAARMSGKEPHFWQVSIGWRKSNVNFDLTSGSLFFFLIWYCWSTWPSSGFCPFLNTFLCYQNFQFFKLIFVNKIEKRPDNFKNFLNNFDSSFFSGLIKSSYLLISFYLVISSYLLICSCSCFGDLTFLDKELSQYLIKQSCFLQLSSCQKI